jgi:hypothetical protein
MRQQRAWGLPKQRRASHDDLIAGRGESGRISMKVFDALHDIIDLTSILRRPGLQCFVAASRQSQEPPSVPATFISTPMTNSTPLHHLEVRGHWWRSRIGQHLIMRPRPFTQEEIRMANQNQLKGLFQVV